MKYSREARRDRSGSGLGLIGSSCAHFIQVPLLTGFISMSRQGGFLLRFAGCDVEDVYDKLHESKLHVGLVQSVFIDKFLL